MTIDAPADVALFTSAEATRAAVSSNVGSVNNADAGKRNASSSSSRTFAGENLRNFAILAGRSLQTGERTVGATRVRAVWTAEHE